MGRRLAGVVVAAGVAAGAATTAGMGGAAATGSLGTLACTGSPSVVTSFAVSGDGSNGAYGYEAVPSATPKGIVAVAHGYQQTAGDMTGILEKLAADDGVIAFAVDNTGTVDASSTSSRGWRVREGAADIIATTRALEASCQGAAPRFVNSLVGISMGGDTSGITAAAHGTRPADASPLFDYWFDVSGVTDLSETFTEATLDSPLSGYATEAVADIEQETGGTPATAPTTYLSDSPAALASAMKGSGLKGAAVFHAVMDGLVTFDEGPQMVGALQAAGIPVDVTTAVFQAPGYHSTTLDGDFAGVVPGYTSPFAGHVNGVMLNAALGGLQALYADGRAPSGLSVTVADGKLGTTTLLRVPGA